jgi:hypothetical protein
VSTPPPRPALEEFFAGRPAARDLFEAVRAAVDAAGPAEIRVGRSQVAFRRRVGFAYAWIPGRYLRSDVPLVLTLALGRRDPSPRWKEVVEPRPGRFAHHLELRDAADVDEDVRAWIAEAWVRAG